MMCMNITYSIYALIYKHAPARKPMSCVDRLNVDSGYARRCVEQTTCTSATGDRKEAGQHRFTHPNPHMTGIHTKTNCDNTSQAAQSAQTNLLGDSNRVRRIRAEW